MPQRQSGPPRTKAGGYQHSSQRRRRRRDADARPISSFARPEPHSNRYARVIANSIFWWEQSEKRCAGPVHVFPENWGPNTENDYKRTARKLLSLRAVRWTGWDWLRWSLAWPPARSGAGHSLWPADQPILTDCCARD